MSIDVLIVGLATWQIVEVMQHSELTLRLRTWASKNASVGVLRSLLSRWIICAFCKSIWFAAVLSAMMILANIYSVWWSIGPYLLAAARLSNLGNDFAYEWTRSPKHDVEEDDDFAIEDGPPTEDGEQESPDI